LLISSAVDRSLDKVDLTPVRGAKVYLETKYLDCVDKNYVIVSIHQRLMTNGSILVEKPEDADVVMEVGSGAVGTDRQDMFVGITEIPLPPPSPISIPRLSLFTRTKAMGTAKLRVAAYDVKTKVPVINPPVALARADAKTWNVMGAGPRNTGTVHEELLAATGESDNMIDMPGRQPQTAVAGRSGPGFPFSTRR